MAATLIKNGRIVAAVDDYPADILVSNGRVNTIGVGSVGLDVPAA
jgi:dihydroorotase-like cyclic amidohydrolase